MCRTVSLRGPLGAPAVCDAHPSRVTRIGGAACTLVRFVEPAEVRVNLGLEGKRIMVGGASRGLGAAIAAATAAEGARVAAVARESDDLVATAERVGGTAIAADFTSADGPADAVRRAV